MNKRIQDQFANLPVSRQRKYQLRKLQQRCCIICGLPLVTAAYCLSHAVKYRERSRAKHKVRRRYYGARTYALQNRNGQVADPWLTGRSVTPGQLESHGEKPANGARPRRQVPLRRRFNGAQAD